MAKHTVIQHHVVVKETKHGGYWKFRCSCGYSKAAYTENQAYDKAIIHLTDMRGGGE